MTHGARSPQARSKRRSTYRPRQRGEMPARPEAFPPGSHSDERDEYQLTWTVTLRASTRSEALEISRDVAEDFGLAEMGGTGVLTGPDGYQAPIEMAR